MPTSNACRVLWRQKTKRLNLPCESLPTLHNLAVMQSPVRFRIRFLWCLAFGLVARGGVVSASDLASTKREAAAYVPNLAVLATPASSELRELVERYQADRERLQRFWSVPQSARQDSAFRSFSESWLHRLLALPVEGLGVEGRIDAVLLRAELVHELRRQKREITRMSEITALLPVVEGIAQLQESRRVLEPVDPK